MKHSMLSVEHHGETGNFLDIMISSCCYSVAKWCLSLCDPLDCSTPGSLSFTISWSLLKLMSTESMMPSNHLILCCPLILLVLVFSSLWVFLELAFCIRGPKYWSFSFSVSHFNEHSGLIFFRIDFFDILLSKGLTGVFSRTTVQKHQFFGAQPCLRSNSHICTWPLDRYTLVIRTVFLLPYIPSKCCVYLCRGKPTASHQYGYQSRPRATACFWRGHMALASKPLLSSYNIYLEVLELRWKSGAVLRGIGKWCEYSYSLSASILHHLLCQILFR